MVFSLHFLNDWWSWASSHMLIHHSHKYSDQISCQIFCPFLILSLSPCYYWIWGILSKFWVYVFANIFSKLLAISFSYKCLFEEHKVLILMKASLSIFSFMDNAFFALHGLFIWHMASFHLQSQECLAVFSDTDSLCFLLCLRAIVITLGPPGKSRESSLSW